jgi:Zn-dependent M28 family amino/carboxypeptidase
MEAAGLKVTLQKFSSSRTSCENVVGVLQGETDSYIVIGGHLDHLGKKGNSIYYGADDNASGATATVEIAEAMAKMKKPKHTIIFICFNAEEQGLIGSSYYVKNALYPIKNTIFMENFDMIGYYKKNGFNIQGGSKIPMVSKAVELLKPKYPNLKVGLTSSAGGGSDHVPFGSAGVPSVFFHTGTHPYYHTPKDTVEKIDFAGMCEIVRFGFDLVCEIDKSN